MCAQSIARGPVDSMVAVSEEIRELNLLHSSWSYPQPASLPCQRSVSAISEFLPLAPFRSRSRPSTSPAMGTFTPSLPRGGTVSVARLYDWSDQEVDRETFVSVSRLYREIAKAPKASLSRSQSERIRSWPAGAQWFGPPGAKTRMNPGRMFLREKGVLTKGEKEIIEGIYKNRGDLRREQSGVKSEYMARSHHDAWLVGKPCAVHKPSSEMARPPPAPFPEDPQHTMPAATAGPGLETSDLRTSEEHSSVTCAMCLNEQSQRQLQQEQLQKQLQQQQQEQLRKQQQQQLRKQQQQELQDRRQKQLQRQQQKQKQQQKQQPPSSLKQKRTPVTSPREKGVPHTGRLKAVDMLKGSATPSAPPSSPEATSLSKFLMPSVSPARPLTQQRQEAQPSQALQEPLYAGSENPHTAEKPGAATPFPQRSPAEQESCVHRQSGQACDASSRGGLEAPEPCGQSQCSQDSDDSRRRLHVEVYLPQIAPEPTEEELKSGLLQGRPALARERPLSHTRRQSTHRHHPSPGDSDNRQSVDNTSFEHRQESSRLQQQQQTSRKPPSLYSSGVKTVTTNSKISALSAEMEDWRLADE